MPRLPLHAPPGLFPFLTSAGTGAGRLGRIIAVAQVGALFGAATLIVGDAVDRPSTALRRRWVALRTTAVPSRSCNEPDRALHRSRESCHARLV